MVVRAVLVAAKRRRIKSGRFTTSDGLPDPHATRSFDSSFHKLSNDA